MVDELFCSEGIHVRLLGVKPSSLIFICEVPMESVTDIKRIASTKKDRLRQLGIDRIELEYNGISEVIQVSLLG